MADTVSGAEASLDSLLIPAYHSLEGPASDSFIDEEKRRCHPE
jgi:hypothetical protein